MTAAEPATQPDYPWLPLSARAFAAAMRGDDRVAVRLIERIVGEHGPDAILGAMISWLDTLLIEGFGQENFQTGGVGFYMVNDADEPETVDGTQPPEAVWAGRLMAARAAGDKDQFDALIKAATGDGATPASWARHVHYTLTCCALTYRYVKEGQP